MALMVPLFLWQGLGISKAVTKNLVEAAQRTAPLEGQLVLPSSLRLKFLYSVDTEAELLEVLDTEGIDESYRPPRSVILTAYGEGRLNLWGGGSSSWRAKDGTDDAPRPGPALSEAARHVLLNCLAALLLVLAIIGLLLSFGAANVTLAGGDWVQWWLMTFPVATRALVLARACDYALVQFFPWFTLFPLTYVALDTLGQPWPLPIAACATLTTTFLTGALRLWLETKMRMRLSLQAVKSVQGAATLGAISLLAFAFWFAASEEPPFAVVDFWASLPPGMALLPGTWPFGLPDFGYLAAIAGVGATVLTVSLAVAGTSRMLSRGMMQSSGVDASASGQRWTRGRGLNIVGKEIALLKRDRNFLVQTIAVPIAIIVLQLILNPKLGDAEGVGVAILAYVVGFYGATGGCFQVLSSEGRALWMLYTLPVSAQAVLRKKVRIWASLCCVLGLTALVVFSANSKFEVGRFVEDFCFVSIGVWCAAHIASATSVIGANTTTDAVQQQPKQRFVWLFMLLAGSYISVLALPDLSHRLAGTTVFVTLSYALWQRAADRLRWLLDPVEDSLHRLTLLDAGGAMLTFFVLQTIGTMVLGSNVMSVSLAFAAAGVATLAFFFVRLGSRNVPIQRELGMRSEQASTWRLCITGGAIGAALGGVGLLYVAGIHRLAPDLVPDIPRDDLAALLFLGVVCAPIIEELLFRGLLLGALQRSVKTSIAIIWSALVFTFVHPMASWPPVFAVGIACAALRLRGGYLPACMVLHATYNAVVIYFR